MIARRSAMGASERADGSAKVAAHARRMLEQYPGATVAAFLSIGDEFDTAPLMVGLVEAGHPLCLPVMQGKGQPLLFRAYAPGDEMATVMWVIREPLASQPLLTPSVLIVPLLAFDGQGWRLGYGGGFYDRTLRLLRDAGAVTAIGAAFDIQEVDAVPHLDYDQRLDWVLTPSGPRRFER